MAASSSKDTGLGTGAIIAFIAAFVVLGAPMVYYLWTTLNEALAGQFDPDRLLASVGMLLIFGALLFILSRSIRRLEERHH